MSTTSNKTTAGLRYVSGFGKYHSNEPTAMRPKPYAMISYSEIAEMVMNPQQADKGSAQWVIPSTLPSRSFNEQEDKGSYGMLWADFDTAPKPIAQISSFWDKSFDSRALFYSSASAKLSKQKSRLIVPLDEQLTFKQWTMAQECLAEVMCENGFVADFVTARSAQLCYLPNRGEFYDYYFSDGQTFDPMSHFSDRIAAKVKLAEDEERKRKEQAIAAAERRANFKAQGNISAADAFNANYTVEEVLLMAGYRQQGNHFRHKNSESGGYSASVKNGRVFTLSPNDPLWTGGAGNGAHDAFSAYAVLFYNGNARAAARSVYEDMKGAA